MIVNGLATVLEPGTSDQFTIGLSLPVTGTPSGVVSFTTNDSDENPFTFFIATSSSTTNTPPTIVGLPDVTLLQNTTLEDAIDLTEFANDNETPADELSYSIANITNVDAGVTIDGNHRIDIQPSMDWVGQSDVTIRVTDPDGEFDEDTFRVTVTSDCEYHNASFPEDVNGNGIISPLDALLVINELDDAVYSDPVNGQLLCNIPNGPFFDVNNDGFVSPIDALQTINRLNESAATSVQTEVLPSSRSLGSTDYLRQTFAAPSDVLEDLDHDHDHREKREQDLFDLVFAGY